MSPSPDSGPTTQGPPWFVVRIKALFHALLYDEASAQRYLVAGLLGLGFLVRSGGVIPGTDTVVPIPAWLAKFGGLIQMGAVWLAAGGSLPSGKGADPARPSPPPIP